jgi:predicted transcriptional regulator
VRVKDITSGRFLKGDRFETGQLITELKEQISRVRVLGTVVSKFISDDGKFGSVTLDDGTDTISLRVFGEDVKLIKEIDTGDIVDAVGRVREYEGEKYVSLESVWKIEDPNWELVRKLELVLKASKLAQKEKPDPKGIVLDLIEKSDQGKGVKYVTLLDESGLNEDTLEGVLKELMNEGEIYEPKIGRFKRV